MISRLFIGATGALAAVSCACAHITLERREAPVGASYKAVMRVPHGCDGSPTTAIRVRIPEGIITTLDQFNLIVHRSCSFGLLRRSTIRSISCLGVSMPVLDFF